MTDTKQHEALRLADELCEAIAEYPEPTALEAQAAAELRRQHARITELEAQLAQRFDAADMATAAAQGFRDGAASLAASAGSEPVGYWDGEFSKDGGATIYEVPQVSAFGRKYGNIPLYTHPSPPEGMVGGWISVEDRLPKLYTEVLIHPRPTAYCCEGEVDTQGRWSCGEYETGFGHHQIACEVTHWMPLPPPPTTSAGSGKGE